ncbi:MAG: helix-turn-helix transcriptional regulator [Clostridia bacterium]|nr:helix-turn-helix transcriptional regulator [Clostridia bacterium]
MLCDNFKERYDGLPLAIYARDWSTPLSSAQTTFCHNHREIEMVCVLEGNATVHIGNTTQKIKKGDTFFVSPYVLHYTEIEQGAVYVSRCICFDAALLQNDTLAKALEEGTSVLTAVHHGEKVFTAVQRIYDACVNHADGWRMEVQGWLLLLFSLLKREQYIQTTTLPQGEAFCRQVLMLLREHYAEDITSAHIATALFLSHGHFCRRFKANFNDNFSNYLRRFRLEKACEILCESQASVTEIARLVGFDDPSYFTKCFRETFGVTPRTYKRKHVLV